MNTRKHTKLIQEGSYIAEVDIDLIETDEPWSPYLSLDDAYRLDEVREALRSRHRRSPETRARMYIDAGVCLTRPLD